MKRVKRENPPSRCERFVPHPDTGRKRRCPNVARFAADKGRGLKLCLSCRDELRHQYEFELRFAKAQLQIIRALQVIQ